MSAWPPWLSLAGRPLLRIGGALVGGVGTFLALEIHHPCAVATGFGRFAVLGLEALEKGPGVDQDAVHGEVIGGQQLVLAGQTHHLVEDASGDVGSHQSLAQAAEVRLIESARFQGQIEKPAEQQVVSKLLAEQPVRAHRVEGNQQLGFEQALRRNRRSARLGVKAFEFGRNGRQCRLGQFFHPAQRVNDRNPGLDREIVKHLGLGIHFAPHRCIS